MISVVVAGVAGRMGARILSLLQNEDAVAVVGATEKDGNCAIGKDAGAVTGFGNLNVCVSSSIAEAAAKADAIVDFTSPLSTLENARYASMTGKAMVIGTTGFTDEEKRVIESLARDFPCVISPNMSVGVNIMFEASKFLARFLGDDFDIEIIEAHHKHKADSPSGTALGLGEAVAEALGRDLQKAVVFERHGRIGEREQGEIGIQAIRGGDIVGEHTVMFCGMGERIELIHRAASRDNFARGAVRALRWVVGKPPGIYTMKDVLGI